MRLLLGHPEFELVAATSNELAGKRIDQVYPAFVGVTDLAFCRHDDPSLALCEVVFLAVPHTAAMKQAPELVERGVAVIDLSADFRLKDPAVYEAWYGVPHTAVDLLDEAAFGLPELFNEGLERLAARHVEGHTVLVECAGCYPTATSLAAAPALRAGLVGAGLIVADAVSGVTGAGKKATERTHFCFADEDVEAYGVSNHRHTPEIEEVLSTASGLDAKVIFTPHLTPMDRGILTTTYSRPLKDASQQDVLDYLRDFYKDEPFVQVVDAAPSTKDVIHTNRCHLTARVVGGRLLTISVIDNLIKGAAGAAVQNFNIIFGLEETTALV